MALGSIDGNYQDENSSDCKGLIHILIHDFSDDVALNTQSSKIHSCPTNPSSSDETNNPER